MDVLAAGQVVNTKARAKSHGSTHNNNDWVGGGISQPILREGLLLSNGQKGVGRGGLGGLESGLVGHGDATWNMT